MLLTKYPKELKFAMFFLVPMFPFCYFLLYLDKKLDHLKKQFVP